MRATITKNRRGAGALAALLLLVAPLALAQQRPVTELTWYTAENPGVILVQNARIWTQGPDGILENADMLVRDGEIAEIGSGLSAPAGAMVIDASGMEVTPGLIDAHSHTAADAINEGSNSVTAEVSIEDVLNPDDLTLYRQLAGGLTAAQVLHGSANSIGGQAAIIKLRYGVDEGGELLIEDVVPTIKFALGENVKRNQNRYPNTRQGVEQTIRSAFLAAQDYQLAWEEYNSLSEEEQERRVPPRTDLQLQTLVEILEGERKVHSHSYRQDEILMLIRVADEFGFQIGAFQHVLEGYKVAHEIAAHGAGASTFSDWWAYKIEAYDAIPYNGAIMHDDGVVVSFNSDNGDLARRMNLEAAKAVKYGGLAEDEALKFVTINSAIQLGIDDRVGSLEVGKDADFVIWNGSPLSVYSRPQMTFIEGRKVFDRDLDLQMRANIEAERDRLLALARSADGDDEVSGARGRGRGGAAPAPAPATIARNPDAVERQYQRSMLPDPGIVAIVGATVHTVTGGTIENGVVVMQADRITAVGGPGTQIPSSASRIDATGRHLYPGMISADSTLGLSEIGSVDEGNDLNEMGDFNANIRAEVAVNPESTTIPVSRANGITHAVTVPGGGLIMGTSALLRLDGWTWEQLTAVAPTALHISFPSYRSGGGRGGGRGGGGGGGNAEQRANEQVARIEAKLDDVRAYAKAKEAEAAGGPRYPTDPRLEAMVPVINGEVPVFLHTTGVATVRKAVEWGAKQGFRVVLVDTGDSWRAADFLAEQNVPVVLTSILSMPMRSDEPYDGAYARAARLHEAGVTFAIASGGGNGGDGPNLRNMPYQAGVAAAFGLPREEALKSVTLYPAQILGVDNALGSIEVGKSASLVLTDGDILEIRTNVLQEWIDGRPVDLSSKHTDLWEKYRDRPRPVGGQ
ncbi:MAG TPA: amidohydrolase family protein [Acidobacteriota bacterium]